MNVCMIGWVRGKAVLSALYLGFHSRTKVNTDTLVSSILKRSTYDTQTTTVTSITIWLDRVTGTQETSSVIHILELSFLGDSRATDPKRRLGMIWEALVSCHPHIHQKHQ